ncbi:MAG: protein-glutamate O-methyltransferase CheR [candidate division NC10 bacterium]|nr:protein-glutamate O-methyltransferase CheR [candidate division NC10 bacterium]
MAPGTPRTATRIVGPGLQGKLEAEAFSGLRDLILRAGGIDLDLYKEKCVLRRITVRQRACGAPSLRAYLKLVSSDPAERSRLVKALTIHVSQFFRNPSTFRAIQEEILPSILTRKQRGGGRALRLWSVGCAHGEEPYSLAILLLETGAQALQDYSSSIYATDIDPTSLQHAKEARYPEASLVQVPARWRQRYFLPDRDRYVVVPEVRRLVFFKGHNILDPLPFGRIDLLVCRNVLIYMTEVLQERVLLALSEALNPGGFLVLGKVEGLAGAARDCFEPVDVAERIYRKPELRSTRAA